MHFKLNVLEVIYLKLISAIFLSMFLSSCSKDPSQQPVEEPTLASISLPIIIYIGFVNNTVESNLKWLFIDLLKTTVDNLQN